MSQIELPRPEGLSDYGWGILNQLHTAAIRDPEVLLEREGAGRGGDVTWALLIGHDDQHEALWRIPRAEPVLRRPIPAPVSLADESPSYEPLRTADYRPTNAVSMMWLDAVTMERAFGPHPRPEGGTVSLVRYRRVL